MGWGEAKTRVGLLLAPDLRSVAKKLGRVDVELSATLALLRVAKENVATAKGPGSYLDTAAVLVALTQVEVQEGLQTITGRKP